MREGFSMFSMRLFTHRHSEHPSVGFYQSVSFDIHTVNTSELLHSNAFFQYLLYCWSFLTARKWGRKWCIQKSRFKGYIKKIPNTIFNVYVVCFSFWKHFVPLGTNFRELLNIQKRERPRLGPSFTNSWPRPFPHLPQLTCKRWYRVQIYQPAHLTS